MLENFGLRINRTAAADDDAKIVFGQPALKSLPAKLCAAPPIDFRGIHRTRATHNSIGGGAQFKQSVRDHVCRQGRNSAIRGRDFSVRRQRHVDEDKRRTGLFSRGRVS